MKTRETELRAPKWIAGLKLRKQPTRKRTSSTAQAVAVMTKCPAGSLTKSKEALGQNPRCQTGA